MRRARQEVPLPGGRISWSLSVGESEDLSPSPCSSWMPPVTGGSQLNGHVSSFQAAEAPSASSGEAELFPGASGRSCKHQLSAPSLSLSVSPGARPSGPQPHPGVARRSLRPAAPAAPCGDGLSPWPRRQQSSAGSFLPAFLRGPGPETPTHFGGHPPQPVISQVGEPRPRG